MSIAIHEASRNEALGYTHTGACKPNCTGRAKQASTSAEKPSAGFTTATNTHYAARITLNHTRAHPRGETLVQ